MNNTIINKFNNSLHEREIERERENRERIEREQRENRERTERHRETQRDTDTRSRTDTLVQKYSCMYFVAHAKQRHTLLPAQTATWPQASRC